MSPTNPNEGEVRDPRPVAADEPAFDFRPVRAGLVIALLMALYVLSYVDRSIVSLLIEPIKADLGLSDLQVSLIVGAAFSVFYATMGLPLGWVADRWNRRNLIAIGVTIWSLMTALGGLAHNYAILFISRMGVGLGEAALAPAGYSMIADLYPKRLLGRAMALFALSTSLGSGLALILGGAVVAYVAEAKTLAFPVVGELAAWRAALILVGLPGVLLAALVMLIQEPVRRGPRVEVQGGGSALAFFTQRWRALLPLYVGLGLISVVFYGMMMWSPTLFVRKFDIPAAEIALPLGGVIGVAGMIGMLAGGYWADRLWQRGVLDAYPRVIFNSALMGVPCFIAFPLMPTPTLTLIVIFAGAFCMGLQSGLPAGTVQMITPNDLRARITAGCFFAVGLMGLGLGPSTIAMLSDLVFGAANLHLAMAVSNLVVLPLAALVLFLGLKAFRGYVAAMETGPS